MEKLINHNQKPKEKIRKFESKKHREALKNKLIQKRKIIAEAKEKELRLKVETQIGLLTKILDNLNENFKDNISIRSQANIFIKGVDLLTLNTVKKGLDESLDNSIKTYENLSNNVIESLKSTELTEDEKIKLENILGSFIEHMTDNYLKENSLPTEKTTKIVADLTKNLEFIEEGRNGVYAHIKRINRNFIPNFDCLYISANKYGVPAGLLVAVMQNDSSLGKHMASENNFGNVGNDDFGNRRSFDTPQEGIDAVAKNLKRRIEKFEKHVKDRNPTVIEIITGKIEGGKRFFGKYMSNPQGPIRVAKIYKKLADTPYIESEDNV